jgi:hypothetical protein
MMVTRIVHDTPCGTCMDARDLAAATATADQARVF